MNLTAPSQARSAFTLVELVISAAVMSVILTAAYLCLNSGVSSQRLVESRADAVQSARVALAILSADLRCACPLSQDMPFLGMQRKIGEADADNLDFATHHYAPRRAGEGDFCQVSYFLEKDPGSALLTLWRRRNPRIGLDPLSGGSREELANGLRGLKFEYYDGFDWYAEWGDLEGGGKAESSWRYRPNLYGMPEAVRITLWLDPSPGSLKRALQPDRAAEAPLMFQTVARLNLAARTQGEASGGESGDAGEATQGRSNQDSSSGGNR